MGMTLDKEIKEKLLLISSRNNYFLATKLK